MYSYVYLKSHSDEGSEAVLCCVTGAAAAVIESTVFTTDISPAQHHLTCHSTTPPGRPKSSTEKIHSRHNWAFSGKKSKLFVCAKKESGTCFIELRLFTSDLCLSVDRVQPIRLEN